MPSRNPRSLLNAIAFFLADLQMGLGPLLAVYLVAVLQWEPAQVGLMVTAGGLATLLMQVPMGALVDATHKKRLLMLVATLSIGISTLVVPFIPSFTAILINTLVLGVAAAFFGPAMASMVMGVVGQPSYDKAFARTQVYQHLGTVFYAGVLLASVLLIPASTQEQATLPFYLLPILGVGLVVSVLLLPEASINHEWARGNPASVDGEKVRIRHLVVKYPLIWKLALALFLFHLGNAAMLFLISEQLAAGHSVKGAADAIVVASGSILAAQAMMVVMAFWVTRKVGTQGRKFFLIIAFAVLPIRGVLLSLDSDIAYMFTVQLLDGVGAGLIGAVVPIVLADIVRGSGHYNLALGFLLTAQGVGAALSQTLGGLVATYFSFPHAFILLAAIAALAFVVMFVTVPETGKHQDEQSTDAAS